MCDDLKNIPTLDSFCDIMDYIDTVINSIRSKNMNPNSQNLSSEIQRILQCSNSQIKNAGKTIIDPDSSKEEYDSAIHILNDWRTSHTQPLRNIANDLQERNPEALVMQRLKRLESITGKLKRFPEMDLYRMQDLGGCRVIVNSVEDVYNVVNDYKNSQCQHIFRRGDDYIQKPKNSGYRSYHMVYKFQSNGNDDIDKLVQEKAMLIEVQVRTKLQHIWATAVEMMGLFTKSNLKSSQGNEDILRFFVLVSSVFAIEEGTTVCPNTPSFEKELALEIGELNKKHNILPTLDGLNISIHHSSKIQQESSRKDDYYLLILDYGARTVRVIQFPLTELENATQLYNKLEKRITSAQNIVLTSASSFDDLREGYPNYFADIRKFTAKIRGLLRKYI